MAARIAMMAITTNNSMRVNAFSGPSHLAGCDWRKDAFMLPFLLHQAGRLIKSALVLPAHQVQAVILDPAMVGILARQDADRRDGVFRAEINHDFMRMAGVRRT